MDSPNKILRDPEFWRAHISQAEEFSGTYGQYCELNGLSKSTFHAYKKRLGFNKFSKIKRRAFVEVTPIRKVSPEPAAVRRGKVLPDPRWVAEVLMAIGGER